ncbi:MAG: hypothetical protein PWP38_2753 [Clostridiales bacterium]|jgi:AcrR family transcriptional regulator|nr:hypothetical protein [Clostridiales bacterium]
MTYENLLSLSKDEFMRSKIVLSLKQLLLDSSLRKLTVTSICEHAGIARSSFYNLFTDVDDALNWEYGRLMDIAIKKYPFCTNWRLDLVKQSAEFMTYEMQDGAFYQRIAKDMNFVDYSSLFLSTRRKRAQLFHNALELWQGAPADERCSFEIKFYVCAESDTVAKWMVDMKESPEDVARKMAACIPEYLGKVMDASFAAYLEKQAAASS